MPVNYPPNQNKPVSFFGNAPQQGDGSAVQFVQPQMPSLRLPFQDTGPADRQEALARAILSQGIDSSPVNGGFGEALTRVGSAILGAITENKANAKRKDIDEQNAEALRGALENGDVPGLLSSGNDLAEKLGGAILEKQMTPRTSYETLSPEEARAGGYPEGAVVQRDSTGREYVVSKPQPPNVGLPPGWQWNATHTGWEPIPGGPSDPNSPLNKQRAGFQQQQIQLQRDKLKKTDDGLGGDEPWTMKW